VDFLTLCKTPELATEVTVQPIDRLGVDAAILFADILLPLEAMGAELRFVAGDGPTFPEPIRKRQDIARLVRPDVDDTLGYVFETIRQLRRALEHKVPLIGFAGTPWTLAAYLVEGSGSKTFPRLGAWSYADPEGLSQLLELIADVQIDYLLGQLDAGAQALQLFDTWGGLLDAERYRRLALPPLLRIFEAIGDRVPRIYYSNGTAHLLPILAELPVDVLSVDWRMPLSAVREIVGPGKVLQGNLDPTVLLSNPEEIHRRTRQVIAEGKGGGHIMNLGHGIHKDTPPDNALAFVKAVRGEAP
jgi:uroporphyrinogen decarboxylase